MTEAPEDLKVVFLMGNPRSGSTLLANLMGELDGFFATGELETMWRNGVHGPRAICGCGLPIADCPQWQAILGPLLVKGQFLPVKLDQEKSVRIRNVWAHPAPSASHMELMGRVYRDIARETGARVLVDSSKDPAYAATFHHLAGIDTYQLHIVRDPRATLFSRQRGWRGDDSIDAPPLPLSEVVRVAGSWLRKNAEAEAVYRHWPRSSVRIRYEDLMANPVDTLHAILAAVAEPREDLGLESPHVAHIGQQHTAAGNPSRFRSGSITLNEDLAWRDRVPRSQQRLVAAMTAPLMRRYGYPIRTPATAVPETAEH